MEKIKKYKKNYIGIGVLAIALCIVLCCIMDKKDSLTMGEINENSNLNDINTYKNIANNDSEKNRENSSENTQIFIHIAGEVVSPGVYKLEKNSRIKDAIDVAGGLKETADISRVNLVYVLSDGQKINIPKFESSENNTANNINQEIVTFENNSEIAEGKNKKININTATQTEFECLSGIGPSLAAKILKFRQENGKFKSIEDLKNVPGIGESKYSSIENEITV